MKTTDNPFPPFDVARSRFCDFVSANQRCDELRFVIAEEIVHLTGQVYVRLHQRENTALVEEQYATGIERGFGVHVNVYCFVGNQALCYIWLPRDAQDADYRMLSGLKFSVPTEVERRPAIHVRSWFRWKWLCFLIRWRLRRNWADDTPGQNSGAKD